MLLEVTEFAMRLVLEPSSTQGRVMPSVALDYNLFRDRFGTEAPGGELFVVERFYGVHLAIGRGYGEVYVEGELRTVDGRGSPQRLRLDVVGQSNSRYLAILCETSAPSRALRDKLELLSEAENAETVLVFPSSVGLRSLFEDYPQPFERKRFTVERLWWLDSEPEETFGDLLQLVDLLANETRMRMLVPLLERPCGKRVYRREINPKLVYANISRFLQEGLVQEADTGYSLTPLGGRVMGEYLIFLERMRKVLVAAREANGLSGER